LEKLQAQITSTSRIEESEEQRVVAFTSSCGLAEFTVDESAEDLLRRADEALYVAKRTGKNRVVIAKKTKSLWQTLRPFLKTEKS